MKRAKGWVVAIFVMVIGVVSAVAFLDYSGRGKLDRVLEDAKAAGIPISAADLRSRPPSSSDNAAPDYRKAIDAIFYVKSSDKALIDTYNSALLTPEPAKAFTRAGIVGKVDRKRVMDALKSWNPVFTEVERASVKTKLDWNRQWEKGLALVFDEFGQLREIEKALLTDARAAAWQRDTSRIQLRLRQSRHMSDLVGQEPTYLASLVSIAMHVVASVTAAQIAYDCRDDAVVVESIRHALEQRIQLPDMRTAIGGEIVFGRGAMEMIAREPMSIRQFSSTGGAGVEAQFVEDAKWMKLPWVRTEVEAALVDKYVRGIKSLPDDPNDIMGVEKALSEMDEAFSQKETRSDRIASNFAPNLAQIGEAIVNAEIMRRLAVLLTLAIDQKRRTGRWPAECPQRTGADIDPYANAPFRYRLLRNGIVLYSIGANRKDDGGDVTAAGRLDRCMGIVDGRFVRR